MFVEDDCSESYPILFSECSLTALSFTVLFRSDRNGPRSKPDKETYGSKSTKTAPHVPELKEFEDGLLSIIRCIQFRNINNTFQKKTQPR